MGTRKSMDFFAFSLMVGFCLVMAFQQVLLKAVATDLAPVFQIALRSGIGAVLIGMLMIYNRQGMRLSAENRIPAMTIGTLFALEYLMLGEALNYTSAGHAAVFLYTSPIFAAIGLHWKVAGERMSALQWLGIIMAFIGIVISFLGQGETQEINSDVLWGDFLALCGGAAWGLTTVVVRSTGLSNLPAKETLLYQLVGAFIILVAWAIYADQAYFNPTTDVLLSLAFHGVIVAFLSFLLWFWLLTQYKASQLGTLSFLTPLFGVLLGAWFLGETIEASFVMGAGLIITGIILVNASSLIAKFFRKTLKQA
ncbi:DMT family transporter [Oceanospirillum sanctuarii]|uniref:DMT family transporter n=1 Tax=Oceanospirillum sanctuarii TaxID=1434821 RepID=UPI000A391B7B|nr:DMT family transporter [Oceanospirillum sanctuarii]